MYEHSVWDDLGEKGVLCNTLSAVYTYTCMFAHNIITLHNDTVALSASLRCPVVYSLLYVPVVTCTHIYVTLKSQ